MKYPDMRGLKNRWINWSEIFLYIWALQGKKNKLPVGFGNYFVQEGMKVY